MENVATETTTDEKTPASETLVVVSKVKNFIRANSSMNTSRCAIDELSQVIARTCMQAIEHAKSSGRKTVMGKDISA